jgi:hypothetical protein
MSFKKRTIPLTTVGAGADIVVGLGVPYGRVVGFKALATGDTSARIRIKDRDNRIAYLDAADKDYVAGGAGVERVIVYDATQTGLSFTPADATGAALTAADEAHAGPVLRSPITVTWSNGTAGDTLTGALYVEV